MFWNKPKKEETPTVHLTENHVRNSDILVVSKMDENDWEFIRRHQPMMYARIMSADEGDTYYMVRGGGSSDWKIVNQHVLDNEYTKIGEYHETI